VRIDVKGTIGIAVKRLEIKEFKTNHRIFECGVWSFLFGLMEMYLQSEKGKVVTTLLIKLKTASIMLVRS
jgi:hypothetical protein